MENTMVNEKLTTGGLQGCLVNFWQSEACTTYAQPMHKPCTRSEVKEDKQNLTASERVSQMMETHENPVNSLPVCGLRMLR